MFKYGNDIDQFEVLQGAKLGELVNVADGVDTLTWQKYQSPTYSRRLGKMVRRVMPDTFLEPISNTAGAGRAQPIEMNSS